MSSPPLVESVLVPLTLWLAMKRPRPIGVAVTSAVQQGVAAVSRRSARSALAGETFAGDRQGHRGRSPCPGYRCPRPRLYVLVAVAELKSVPLTVTRV